MHNTIPISLVIIKFLPILSSILTNRFKDSVTNKEYSARTILQVRVRPDAYKKGVQTMGATEPIDDLFSNEELEWSTDREGVHYIFGILVEMKLI